nr:MAG TPA: Pre-mRNA branch site protein p14 mutant, pre-mRNA splicing, adenine [Caudoviricetes sp.]
MADCFNYSCPFRVNETCSVPNGCECTACPNRCTGDFSIAWNRTLTDEELEKIGREQE